MRTYPEGVNGTAGLYIHVPFCGSKCAYCDFYSLPPRHHDTVDRYISALGCELRLRAPEATRAPWRTVYIGGGTPSSLSAAHLETLVATIGTTVPEAEFTIEANPEDVDRQWISFVQALGINRVSMGVQSFNDHELKAVGRRHTASRALEAIEVLAASGLDYSIDLIYGLPGQTSESWLCNLETMGRFEPPHFSAYMLSFEPGTRLYARLMAGKTERTPDDEMLRRYDSLRQFAEGRGYTHYEISNFAQRGKQAVHNSSYWNGTPYIGLGPGAHSFDGTARGYNPPDIRLYLSKLEAGSLPFIIEEETDTERANDILISSLRTLNGLDLNRLHFLDNSKLDTVVRNLDKQRRKDNLELNPQGRYFIPARHWPLSDFILRELILL